MNRQELIEGLIPTLEQVYPQWSRQGIRDHLGTFNIQTLQKKHDEAVQAGRIVQPKDELSEAREVARKVKQDYLRRENQALVDQVNQSQLAILADKLFQAHAIFPNKVLVDTQATREQLISLVNPGEQIDNPVKWLRKVLQENPALIQTLPFKDFETKRELQQQDQEQQKLDDQTWYEFCRDTEICSPRQANYALAVSVLGRPLGRHQLQNSIVQLPDGVVVIGEDGSTSYLVSISTTESQQFQQEKLQLDQQNLKDMARRGDVAGLRERARRDHTWNITNSAQLNCEYGLLKSWGERESTFPKLPDTWLGQPLDPSFIRKASPDTLRSIMRKHGRCQLDARLHQLAPDFFENWATKLYEIEKQIQTQSGIRSY